MQDNVLYFISKTKITTRISFEPIRISIAATYGIRGDAVHARRMSIAQ